MHMFLRCVLSLCQQAEQNAGNFVRRFDCDICCHLILLIHRIYFISSRQLDATSGDPNNVLRAILIIVERDAKQSSLFITWSVNKVRELITVRVLHTSLLNTTVVAFKVLPLRSYAPIPAPSPPFKTILELVLWNGLQSCRCITPDVINVIKIPSFQYFLYLWEQKKVTGGG